MPVGRWEGFMQTEEVLNSGRIMKMDEMKFHNFAKYVCKDFIECRSETKEEGLFKDWWFPAYTCGN